MINKTYGVHIPNGLYENLQRRTVLCESALKRTESAGSVAVHLFLSLCTLAELSHKQGEKCVFVMP